MRAKRLIRLIFATGIAGEMTLAYLAPSGPISLMMGGFAIILTAQAIGEEHRP